MRQGCWRSRHVIHHSCQQPQQSGSGDHARLVSDEEYIFFSDMNKISGNSAPTQIHVILLYLGKLYIEACYIGGQLENSLLWKLLWWYLYSFTMLAPFSQQSISGQLIYKMYRLYTEFSEEQNHHMRIGAKHTTRHSVWNKLITYC